MTQETRDPGVVALYRYPVKGLSPQAAEALEVTASRGLEADRHYALALGSTAFDPTQPEPLDKGFFLMLRRDESLAALTTTLDLATRDLTITTPDGRAVVANVETPEGRDAIERFFADYVGAACQGRPRLVAAEGHKFTDVSVVSPVLMRAISIINLASVRDLETRCGQPINPLRFRANVYIDGLEPWAELGWVGQELTIGTARFRCILRTKRCAAVDVDPETGARDMHLPKALMQAYGHPDCGVYFEVLSDGRFAIGDAVVPAEAGRGTTASALAENA